MLRKLALSFALLSVFALTACMPPLPEDTSAPSPSPSPTIEVSPSVANSTDQPVAEYVAEQSLLQAGFAANQLRIGEEVKVPDDLEKIAPTGPQAVCQKPILNPEDAEKALKAGTPEAALIIDRLRKQTGATAAEIKDADNWVTIQMWVNTYYPGNTYVDENGELQLSRTGRVDGAGTIGVVFVPPQQVAAGEVLRVGVLRGTCCNPQLWLPMPAPKARVTPKEELEITPNPTPEQPTPEKPRQTPKPTPTPEKPTPTPTPSTTPSPTPTPTPTPSQTPSPTPTPTPSTTPTPTPTPSPSPTPEEPCEPPASYEEWGIPDSQKHLYGWDNVACAPFKLDQEEPDEQNGTPSQPGQENEVDTGNGSGTSTEPTPNPVHTPQPDDEDPAPAPTETSGGYRPPDVEDEAPDGTGSNDGDGATDVGDHSGTTDPEDAGSGGNSGIGDDGQSSGGGEIANPDVP